MSIKVVDAIMGTGKSSAAINYMNAHPNDKFIYITPYLDEAARIRESCPALKFVEPSNKVSKANFTKRGHTDILISDGRNITTTHQSFKNYTKSMLESIKSQEYTLIIDENVDVLEKLEFNTGDLEMAVRAGYINEENGEYIISEENKYEGEALSDMFRLMKSRRLVKARGRDGDLFYWTLPSDLITSFKDVYVLTYLFEGQSLKYMFDMYKMSYDMIGIQKGDDGTYYFCETGRYTPQYVFDIKNMIHIVDNRKLNDIGTPRTSLSKNWFSKGGDDIIRLKNNVYNVINNVWDDTPAVKKMWGTFKNSQSKIQGRGYTKAFLTFNMKATNQFRHRNHLVYAVNVFMNTEDKIFYNSYGVNVDEERYALSVMVQWIWRSAIRDGEEIYIYIPSKRMRNLLTDWMNDISNQEGGVVCA